MFVPVIGVLSPSCFELQQGSAMIAHSPSVAISTRSTPPVIHFNRPYAAEKSFEYMRQAIDNAHTCGDGPFTKKCHAFLEEQLGVAKALLTTSCTDALEMCALLLEIRPGDEIILPSFTFVSTVNAFVLHGATPVFCDVRADTLNLDESAVERLIGPKTKAIIPVHYAGIGCEMAAIMEIAGRHGIPVVEDNAHGLFGKYKGRHLGTFGALATQSFHETKNFNCGEGGALLINDRRFADRAEIVREKGTNRSRFFRGQVDKYTWVDIGSSYLPSDMLAAYLYAQFETSREIQEIRKRIWTHYEQGLEAWAYGNGVRLPIVPKHCEQAYHMFYLLLPSLKVRQALISHLKALGITSPFHYLPLHLSDKGKEFGGKAGDCPVTENASDRLLRLPFYNDLTEADLDRVVAGVLSFRIK
jgi:dTDP-4-amino-4,6-dideoxygalactose transaminase